MKSRDVLFWILVLAAVGVAIWLLIGSPTIEQGLLMITVFIATSEILLWQALFRIDKKTAVGFEKVRSEIKILNKDVNYKLNEIKSLII